MGSGTLRVTGAQTDRRLGIPGEDLALEVEREGAGPGIDDGGDVDPGVPGEDVLAPEGAQRGDHRGIDIAQGAGRHRPAHTIERCRAADQ